jgi:hypothetical protein
MSMGLLDFLVNDGASGNGFSDYDFLPPGAGTDAWMQGRTPDAPVEDLWGGNPGLRSVQNAAQPADLSSLEQQLEAVSQNPKATEAERQQAIAGLQEIRRQQALLAPISPALPEKPAPEINFSGLTDGSFLPNTPALSDWMGGKMPGVALGGPLGMEAPTSGNPMLELAARAERAQAPAPIPARLMTDLMRDFSLTREQAAGFVGNLAHESGGFNSLQEIKPTVPGSRGGFGYAQWTGPRRREFEAWTGENGLDPTSYEANYGFLKHELTNTPEGKVLDSLRTAKSADVATQIVQNEFLRPGIPHTESRLNWTNRVLNNAFPDAPQERVQVADASGATPPVRNTPGGPLSQGTPRMSDSASPAGLLDLLKTTQPQPQSSGWGDMISALGMSMLASNDRRQPFNGQVLAQALALNDKKSEQHQAEAAMAAAVLKIGLTKDPKEAMLMAKNPAVVQLLQQQKTQSENSALLGAEPEFGGARPAPVMSPPAQAPAPVTSPVPPLSRPVAGIQPDTVGTPAGYDWRAGGVPLPQEGPTPPSRPQDVSQGQQGPLGDQAPTQVAAAGNGPIKLPMPPPDDKRTIPQTPITAQAAQAISSGGYGVPTTPDDAYARATALAKRMTLYEARGMKVDGLKPVLEGLLKLALPTDTQREIAAAYRDDPAKAQEMLRAAVDKRDPKIRQSEYAYGEATPSAREAVGNEFLTTEERNARAAIRDPKLGATMAEQKKNGATLINTAEGFEAAQTKARLEVDKEAAGAITKQATQARNLMPLVDEVVRLAHKTPGGWAGPMAANTAKAFSALGIDVPEGASNAEALQSISQRLIPIVREPGATAAAEMDAYLRAVPGLMQSQEGRVKVANMTKKMAQRTIDISNIYRNNLGAPDLPEKLAALDKPLFDTEERAEIERAEAIAAVPPRALEFLRSNKDNTTVRYEFDAKYGKGAADRVLGRK